MEADPNLPLYSQDGTEKPASRVPERTALNGFMFPLRMLLQRWIAPPSELEGRYSWYFRAVSIAFPIVCLAHLFYAMMFFAWNVPILAIYNVGSMAVWAVGLGLSRIQYFYLGAFLGLLEVMGQAILCVQILGWESGFQYYLLTLMIAVFLLPDKRVVSLLLAGLLMLEFSLLYLYSQSYIPWSGNIALRNMLGLINTLWAFGLTAITSLYYIHVAERAESALQVEHARSEALLNNVMPAVIAARLKQNEGIIADSFPHASVLFADIVGFTRLSESLAPDRVVRMLDEVFSRFDALVVKYHLEKIKTIGDAYMVAAGVPVRREDHAQAAVALALEMRQALHAYNHLTGTPLQIRIGVHSGPVVAGVIGKHRFLYDLWGDTVNTASRMESHGIPGEIQVSEATWQLLRDTFVFAERGMVDVKGKGLMRTYLLRSCADAGEGPIADIVVS